jgi:hypothetical protein
MRTESRELFAVGIFSSKSCLRDRIELLLRSGRTFTSRRSAGSLVAGSTILSCLLLAGSLAPRWIAFAQQPAAPAFEVASIKPCPDGNRIQLTYARDDSAIRLPDAPNAAGNSPASDSSPPIFTAIQEQLGLRLQSSKGPVAILVIDHAEKSDAN